MESHFQVPLSQFLSVQWSQYHLFFKFYNFIITTYPKNKRCLKFQNRLFCSPFSNYFIALSYLLFLFNFKLSY